MVRVMELMGEPAKSIGPYDVVVIKPNVQWWNQGAPNLLALKTFVDIIFERAGGFHGEVVLAENCHRGSSPWASTDSGWAARFDWNSDIPRANNMIDLCGLLKTQYGNRFSVRHWIDVQSGGKRVFGPAEGDGYVYCDGTGGAPLIECNNEAIGQDHRSTIMTYPIFKTDGNTTVDFKNGIWERGSYTGQNLRFVNFAALNHHSYYCGMTSSVKNYMGICDLSGGPDPENGGLLTGRYYNFHSFPFNKWSAGPEPGMLGTEIALFMKTIRRADLNITTAEWVGLSSRTEPPIARTCAVMGSADPVALDYHSSKYLLLPNSQIAIHDPDRQDGPLHQYLHKCAESGGGIIDESKVAVISYDFRSGGFQEGNLAIRAQRKWGSTRKALLNYFILRSGI